MVSTNEKMAVFAPIPKASESTAIPEAPGVLRIIRKAKRRSDVRFISQLATIVASLDAADGGNVGECPGVHYVCAHPGRFADRHDAVRGRSRSPHFRHR